MRLWNSANFTETDRTLLGNSAPFVWNCQGWPIPDVPPFLQNFSCEQTKANSSTVRCYAASHAGMYGCYIALFTYVFLFMQIKNEEQLNGREGCD